MKPLSEGHPHVFVFIAIYPTHPLSYCEDTRDMDRDAEHCPDKGCENRFRPPGTNYTKLATHYSSRQEDVFTCPDPQLPTQGRDIRSGPDGDEVLQGREYAPLESRLRPVRAISPPAALQHPLRLAKVKDPLHVHTGSAELAQKRKQGSAAVDAQHGQHDGDRAQRREDRRGDAEKHLR